MSKVSEKRDYVIKCSSIFLLVHRIAVLTISVVCVFFTVALAAYMFHNRKIKVFKVASPIFLMICLVGCGIMYLEMAAIFPILDMYACIATKWTRHMGRYLTQSNININRTDPREGRPGKKVSKIYDREFKLMILSHLSGWAVGQLRFLGAFCEREKKAFRMLTKAS